MAEVLSGVATAIAIIIVFRLLSGYISTRLYAATILVAIAFIYVGFSLKSNPVSLVVLEISFALVLYFMAVWGYTRNNTLIAYGIIIHGLWDIVHHNELLVATDIPGYWPAYCFIIDIVDGIYFLFLFKKEKVRNIIR